MRRFFVSVVCLAIVVGGCSGGCEGTFDPLPKPLPASQTIEGGVQVRVTKSGLRTIATAAKDIIASTIGQTGICVPEATTDVTVGDLTACYTNQCAGGARGCKVNVALGSLTTTAVDSDTLRANVVFSGSASVPLKFVSCVPVLGCATLTCGVSASMSNARIEVDVRVGTAASDGELTLNLERIRALDINPSVGVCGIDVSGITDFVLDLLGTDLGLLIVNLITPTIDGFIQGLLPDPLGIEGVLNVGGLLSSVLPGVEGKVEVHGVPGGYARLPADGISVGVIVGVNADRNTATRGANDSSEPVSCVPQWAPPNLGAAPTSLPRTPGRQTYTLAPAGAFLGSPDPANDLAIGVSQTLLDLAGHHVLSSGALCLGVGSSLVPQLNLGTVGLLIRSLAELGVGTEPILIQVRPTQPITFDIGTGTATSPYLTAHLKDVEIDFYALIFERYIRAFTVTFNMDLGVNAEFMINAQRKPVIVPTLVGLDATKIKVNVSNASILREMPAQIEGVFPTILNLFIPLLAEAIPAIEVPSIEGFTVGDLKLGKEHTTQDDFLAVYASLAKASSKPQQPARATTEGRVVRVTAPPPDAVLAYLNKTAGGALPEVELDLGGSSPGGGALEWQWSLDGGMWRPFSGDRHLVIRDLALGVQGRHSIQVRAREVGDYESTDLDGVDLPFVIDSAAPKLVRDQIRVEGNEITMRAVDYVTAPAAIEWGLGAPGDGEPAEWAPREGRFAVGEALAFAAGGHVKVFLRDEQGNVAAEDLDLHRLLGARADTGGCSVGAGGGTRGAALLVLGLLGIAVLRRRRLLIALGALWLAGCSTTNELGTLECKLNSDCTSPCPSGQMGYCLPASKMCVCMATVEVGSIGAYSDIAVGTGGASWVSAYNSTHGDLMVGQATVMGRMADTVWEFADGVPAGPVVNELSEVRGGIADPGDDVGRFTSIALGGGEPMVSHYDKTNKSLRFSARAGGHWTSYTIDAGGTGKDVGLYTSISVDSTGKPGIAYLAILTEGRTTRSEVRWAQAKNASPASQADWTTSVIEAKAAPADPSMGMLNDIPYVNGVMIASARTSGGDPVVVYHDRPNGDLKVAEWDKGQSKFKAPVVVDGANGRDVGLYPSVAATSDNKLAIAYVDARRQSLLMITYPGGTPEVVDDGMRMDGTVAGGLMRPVNHFVGDNSAIVATGSSRAIIYQDATAHELIMASKGSTGSWARTKIAGSDTPYKGAYGFFASCALSGGDAVMSTFALNQTTYQQWVELFKQRMP